VIGTRGIYGPDNHGTFVASVLGAAKDGVGMHGVAFDATLLMLRVDQPNTCPGSCKFSQGDVATAIDLAVQNKARVINISLGYNQESADFVQAVDRATAAGVVIVIGGGNDAAAEPKKSSLVAMNPAARGTVIIAGGLINAGTDLDPLSNRAGQAANFYLSAVSQGVLAYDKDGVLKTVGGTSFSAPVIAGAVALLAEAFPNLTGQQIVNLLLTTATDMGAPGTDVIYGRGALNLKNAFSPQGTMSLAGSMTPLSLTSNGVMSAAMGDAKGQLSGGVFLDGYKRAYQMDLGRTLSGAAPDAPLHAALQGSYSTNSAALGPLAVSVTTSREPFDQPEARLQQMELSPEQARMAKAIAATAVGRLSAKTAVAFGFSESGRTLQQRLSQQHGTAFLVAGDPASSGFRARLGASIGIRHDFGPLALTMVSESGQVSDRYAPQRFERSAYRTNAIVADRKLGRMRLTLGGSRLDEEATILGGRFSSAFSGAGSTSWFADGAASLDFGSGWGAYASYRRGWTSIRGSNAFVQGGRLSTNAFAFDLTKAGAFAANDKVALRMMQPLRVRTGGLDVNLPVSYDYASGEVGYQQRFLNLAPTGRELDYELSYGLPLLGGSMAANAFVRTDSGHVEWMEHDIGGALRFTLGF
jgi:hypothetical protein